MTKALKNKFIFVLKNGNIFYNEKDINNFLRSVIEFANNYGSGA